MATADFFIKQGDTLPAFTYSIVDNSGNAVNLTTATSVNFVMRALTAQTTTTNAAATITSASTGAVSYTPTATDTATAGMYMANWLVTWNSGAIQTFPTDGYLAVSIENNLTTPGGAFIISLPEAKDYLNIPNTDRSRDAKLLRFIAGLTNEIENITGPILQRIIQGETYDGQGPFISLRKRPVISVNSVTEYRGPIPYPLTQVPSPDLGTIYSYMFEPPGRIVRRTVGGGMTDFPRGLDSVFVSYTAGYAKVPDNVTAAVEETLRVHFQDTQQGPPRAGGGALNILDVEPNQQPVGYLLPGIARELLQSSRRHASIA